MRRHSHFDGFGPPTPPRGSEPTASPNLAITRRPVAGRRAPLRARRDGGWAFRTRHGEAITRRRYNTIFDRARPCLPWAQRTPVSAHVLRYTAINAVGRYGGYAVAQTFAGHSPPSVTGHYLRAHPSDVAATIAVLTGEPHPLATGDHDHWIDSTSRGAANTAR